MSGAHGHGEHGPGVAGPVPARVRRLLVMAVAPLLVATVVGLVAMWPGRDVPARPANLGALVELETATVGTVELVPCSQGPQAVGRCQRADIRITSGPDDGETYELDISMGPGNPTLERGDRIVVGRSPDPSLGAVYYFSDYQRRAPLLLLAGLFAVVVIAIGRVRGVTALLGLVVTFAILIKFILPALLEGKSPLLVAIVGSAAVMFVILYLAHGVNAQTTTALLGTLVSLVLIAVLAGWFVEAARMVNLGSEEATFLQVSASQVDLRGLLLGGILIGSLGVLNDVTVTQASAVWALRAADPTAPARHLYRSAMRIGRDHIASTVDTLVLAYAGASLPLLLLFTLASRPVGDVLTGELMAEEILRTLIGSVGLVASVPITTGLAALVASTAATGGKRRRWPPWPKRRSGPAGRRVPSKG
ncbi:MAG: YibE/F family protein [Acidimicrobiia bacterium]